MTDPATGQRSFLQALKVPFDLKGVAVGALAYVVIILVGRGIGALPSQGGAPGTPGGIGGFFESAAYSVTTSVDAAVTGKQSAGTGAAHGGKLAEWALLYLAVSAFFGVAASRIAGMRLARDEGVGLGDSLGFSFRNLGATLGALLFAAAAMAVFYAFNALTGFLSGIPGVGGFLMIPLFPLHLVSSLVFFLLAFGTFCGLPLILASLAVERNGALDAVSRAFSYVFSRPVLFFFYFFVVGFLFSVLVWCTAAMEGLASWSFTHWFPAGESYGALRIALGRTWAAAIDLRLPDYSGVGFPTWLGAGISWVSALVFHLALAGWAVYYLWGGATAAYFALRRDVDGTEEEEIWVEGQEGERFGEPEKPKPAAASESTEPVKPAGADAGSPPAKP